MTNKNDHVRQGGVNAGVIWVGHRSCGSWCSFKQLVVRRAEVQLGHAFDLHVAVLELPVVVGLEGGRRR